LNEFFDDLGTVPCLNQDVKYDFMADLTGTGDRSVCEICET